MKKVTRVIYGQLVEGFVVESERSPKRADCIHNANLLGEEVSSELLGSGKLIRSLPPSA